MKAVRLDDRLDDGAALAADPGLVREFAQEGLEMLDQIEPGLTALSGPSPDSGQGAEVVHQVFRAFHSMKGSAGFMNLRAIQRLTHECESLLDGARSGRIALAGARAALVLRTADLLRGILERAGAEGHDGFAEADVEAMVDELRSAALETGGATAGASSPPRLQAVPKAPAPPSPASPDSPGMPAADPLQAGLSAWEDARALLSRAGQGALAGLDEIEREALAHALRALATACQGAQRPGSSGLARLAEGLAALAAAPVADPLATIPALLGVFEPALRGDVGADAALGLDPLIDFVEDALATAGLPPLPGEPPAAPLSLPPVESSPGSAGSAGPPTHAVPPTSTATGATSVAAPPRADPGAPPARSPVGEGAPGPARASIRVDAERLDGLVDLVGELIIAQSMLARFGAPAQGDAEAHEAAMAQLAKITRDLQDLSMSLRMVPAATIFQKMTRLVRDIAAKLGKDAELILRGQDTEVDKTVIEQLSDPLVHMIRNALDHGLEPPEERLRAGKPPRGRILLQARQEGDEVRITVRDDGRGLDPERLLRKGIERGLVRGNGAGLSRDEIFRLIFEPGFSTAEEVTDVSGRGVGMDVVKRNVEKLKGRIEIASAPGQGTAVTIRLPLTLAIIEGMRVRVGANQYAIPMAAIRESVRVESSALTRTAEGRELALIRGGLYPVLRLHEFHGVAADHPEPWEGLLVLLEHQSRAFALLVDELLGHHQTVVKGLCPYLGPVPGVSACSILGDGDVSLILDVGGLAERARATAIPA